MVRRKKKRPEWGSSAGTRARVLLECDASSTPSVVASAIESQGYDVQTCEGPEADGCDLIDNGACALLDGTDVVVNMLRKSTGGDAVLDAMVEVRRPPAIVVEMTKPEMDRAAEAAPPNTGPAAEQPTVVLTPVTRDALIDAIEAALAKRDRPVPVWGEGVG